MIVNKFETVDSIVTRNLEAAKIFSAYGIEFCSGERRTLENACIEQNVSVTSLLEELSDLKAGSGTLPDFNCMSIDALAVYVESIHHRYTDKKVVFIRHSIERLLRQHPNNEDQLTRLKNAFEVLAIHLRIHMRQEEFLIFPYIKSMVKKRIAVSRIFRSIQEPLSAMHSDHDHEIQTFKLLNASMVGKPQKDFYGYKVTYSSIKELEMDLKIHMHLENNVLFPRAIDFEKHLKGNLN
jgi:regulator of cell morphogenesis and NO signaling